jgi:hypothetical protein
MSRKSLKKGKLLLPVLLLFAFLPAFSQKSKAQLEREKQENLRKIREAGQLLKETQSEKKNTLAQLEILKKEIEARNNLIQSIGEEI